MSIVQAPSRVGYGLRLTCQAAGSSRSVPLIYEIWRDEVNGGGDRYGRLVEFAKNNDNADAPPIPGTSRRLTKEEPVGRHMVYAVQAEWASPAKLPGGLHRFRMGLRSFSIEALRIAASVVFLSAGDVAKAQQAAGISSLPTHTIMRYDEDWSALADPANRTGRWTENFKYIALSADGSVYLTTGIEVRSRYEGYWGTNWGGSPDEDYIWWRAMPYADLHLGGVRIFAQPVLAYVSGADVPERPVDETGADLLQGFVDAEVEVDGLGTARVALGRRMITLGAGRFVDTRYGPNVQLAFDGIDASIAGDDHRLTVLYQRPVDSRLGNFDDRTSRSRELWSAYGTHWLDDAHTMGTDLYYIGFRDRNAVLDQGSGREVLHTFGTRFFGDTGSWYWNLEAALQSGTFDGARVTGWAVGGEIRRRFTDLLFEPELALTADIISGDKNPDDPKLQTFNPLFPNGKYFGALSPIGPRNLIHLHPSLTFHPSSTVAVSIAGVAYWRQSVGDGIYNMPGILIRSGRASGARYIGSQAEVAVSWQPTPEFNLTGSLSIFKAGRFLRETGPHQSIGMAAIAATFRV